MTKITDRGLLKPDHKLLQKGWHSNSVLSLETLKILLQQEQASEQEDKEDKEEEPT